ncbi:MAG TPA: hypothetical protein VII99_10695 [Bacteroidia bacterium]
MLVLNSGDKALIIIEPANIEELKKGHLLKLPLNMAMAYTPDIVWLLEAITQEGGPLTPERLDQLLAEARKREEVHSRPYHLKFDVNLQKGNDA